jgi:hypothetical protein
LKSKILTFTVTPEPYYTASSYALSNANSKSKKGLLKEPIVGSAISADMLEGTTLVTKISIGVTRAVRILGTQVPV